MEVPAIVLDSTQGVVWVCKNIGKNDPVWVETDLGQNGNRKLSQKKYIAKMSEVGGFNSKIAATVLDVEKGIVWTCANIADEESAWIQKDLNSNTEKEITKKAKPRINIKFDNTEDFLH